MVYLKYSFGVISFQRVNPKIKIPPIICQSVIVSPKIVTEIITTPNPNKIPIKSLLPPILPIPVIITSPNVDMIKQIICFLVNFSWKRIGQTIVTITGAK